MRFKNQTSEDPLGYHIEPTKGAAVVQQGPPQQPQIEQADVVINNNAEEEAPGNQTDSDPEEDPPMPRLYPQRMRVQPDFLGVANKITQQENTNLTTRRALRNIKRLRQLLRCSPLS